MAQPLRAVMITDSPQDAHALVTLLASDFDVDYAHISTPAALPEVLATASWNVAIAAHPLAAFEGLSVLEVVRWNAPHLPVIVVSAVPGEALAVQAMRAGARDYVLRIALDQLLPAVQRALSPVSGLPGLSSDLLQVILDTVPVPVFYKDADGAYLGCNAAFEQFVGRDRRTLIGHTVFDLWQPTLAEIYDKADRELLRRGGTQVYDAQVASADGSYREVRFFKARFPYSADKVGLVGVVLDLTERKRVETQLQELNLALEQRVIERTRELASLLETSRDLSSILDLNELLTVIAQRAIALLNADECTLFRLEDDQATLTPILSEGEYAEEMMAAPLVVGRGITGSCVADRHPILANNAHLDPRAVHVAGTPVNPDEHVMAAPLTFREEIIGAMLISRIAKPPFSAEDLRLLVSFAQSAAIAMRHAWLYQSLESYSEGLEQAVEARTAELRRTTNRVEAILTSSPDAILMLDTTGMIETANPSLMQLFGYALDDVLQQSPVMLADAAHTEAFRQKLAAALYSGQSGRLEIAARRRNGNVFDADVALAPIKQEGTVTGVVCSIRDISALKQVERMKDAFISNVTHELRTPITSLRLYHDLLLQNPARQAVYMDRLQRETTRLQDIIDDLLYLSRLDQGKIRANPTPTDLNTLAQQYVLDRVPLAEAQGLTLHFTGHDSLPVTHVDRGLVGQALSIVLTNALHYTPPGGSVRVSTRVCTAAGQQWVGIAISDTGPGIPPDEVPLLFPRFFRGSVGRDSGKPGTGLGLALFKEIVQRHHGWVEVQPGGTPGEGATFTMWFLAQA